jgi:hypothetical protein
MKIQLGTVLIDDSPRITRYFDLENEACSGSWSAVTSLVAFALDRKISCRGMELLFSWQQRSR